MKQELTRQFQAAFGRVPDVFVRAPGRVELLGNHTDYNQGYVMAFAVDRFIAMAASPRDDARIEVVSDAFPGRASFSVDSLEKDPELPWADYVKGLVSQLRQRGLEFGGFNAAIHGTIPLGGGLSSSAALLVAAALAVRKLYPYRVVADGSVARLAKTGDSAGLSLEPAEKLGLAKVCQAAENEFVGVKCGLLDHISSLFGQADHTVLIDFLNLTVDATPFDHDLAVVVCPSGVKHELVAGEYNERRRLCESAAAKLGVGVLREVDPEALAAGKASLADREYGCAAHIVGENDRVLRGAELLRRGEWSAFGELLFRSHESSRDLFWNSCPELDVLVDLARESAGCEGARLTGGGFGGATLNLVRRERLEEFRVGITDGYAKATGRMLDPIVCQVVDGAG